MILSKKALEKLRDLINEETEYRSGPKLVQFFNKLGFTDSYGQGFPSRWLYTDSRLEQINGTSNLDKCIKEVFAPINFVGRIHGLDQCIQDFNQFLAFDKWKLVKAIRCAILGCAEVRGASIALSRTMRFVPYMDSSVLQDFSLIATVSQRSCCHSGLLMRSLLPLALMDFRVFSSLSSYRPRRPRR
jgi:hypothetical protein